MSSEDTLYPTFLKWGNCKSRNKENPDVITAKVIDPEPFRTQYDWNILAKVNLIDTNIPLRAASASKKLYRQYMSLLKQNKIHSGTNLTIKTWLDKSSKNPEWDLRGFEVSIL